MLSRSLRAAAAALTVMACAGFAGSALADPPPWAPAYGWRAKHGGHHRDRDDWDRDRGRQVVVVERPILVRPHDRVVSCDRSLLAGDNQLVGQILGGALGGLAGAQIGSGNGKLAATAGGAVLGLLVGGEIGRSFDAADAACAQYALEAGDTGRTVTWRDPDDGVGYRLTPTRTFRRGDGYCREYTGTASVGGRIQRTYGTACRQPDGSWRLVN
ncbi:Surface antigen [Tistlia consotensis]|uniref:17 kDa surface antigen n=1 Tax=Tistlia consotensis USBA 355 TaxID=560819 RepID=A0A1Y6BN51_9PROT|nr:glycine zipper 2TM domain-containing protein [Tistlia consotensis]SMF16387.1 Surface antigen [Tistlia consotensis USBA 355]SNR41174.1 Surface antigen [Tistlia consotensis]